MFCTTYEQYSAVTKNAHKRYEINTSKVSLYYYTKFTFALVSSCVENGGIFTMYILGPLATQIAKYFRLSGYYRGRKRGC